MSKPYNILFILLAIIVISESLVGNYAIAKTRQEYVPFDSFGFLKGGSININSIELYKNSNDTVWLIACGRNELNEHYKSHGNEECEDMDFSFCTLAVPLDGYQPKIVNLHIQVNRTEIYMFLFANCNYTTYSANMDYDLINPNGEQLSSEEIPYPSLYTVLLGVWILLTSVWCFNWIKNRNQRIKLHRIISLLPVAKMAFCAASIYYWRTYSQTGVETTEMKLINAVFDIQFEVVFYVVLLVVASGWGVSTSSFGRNLYTIGAVSFGLTIALTASYVLKGYFTFLMMIIYIIIIVAVFRSTNRNLMNLSELMGSQQSQENSDDPNGPENIADKYKMFKSFRVIMLGYLIANMLLLLPIVLFFQYYPWVYQMMLEFLQMTMFICIGWTFRLRDVNIYYQLPTEEASNSSESSNQSSEGRFVELNVVRD